MTSEEARRVLREAYDATEMIEDYIEEALHMDVLEGMTEYELIDDYLEYTKEVRELVERHARSDE